MVTPIDNSQSRKHHQDSKYAIVSRALHRPKGLVASCTLEGPLATWNAIGAALQMENYLGDVRRTLGAPRHRCQGSAVVLTIKRSGHRG